MKKKTEQKRIYGVSKNGKSYSVFFSWWNGKRLPKSKVIINWFEKLDELNAYLQDNFGPDVTRITV